jgi:pimeloyl-ACP methyl ester carboxylesterase
MSGPTWVLLRGLTRESRHWGMFPRSFAQTVGAAGVITLDLPGNGALHALRSPGSVEAMAAHCRRELRQLGVATPVRVLAMSLGAMVATAWAVAAPDEIAAAVLINTSMRPFNPFFQRLRPANYTTLLRLALTRAGAPERERAVLAMTSRASARDDAELLREWVAYQRECPVTAANALRQLWAAARFRAPAANPFRRVLLLGSAADALVDVRCTQQLAQQWSCDVRLHPSAGHDLPLDDAAWVATQVRNWV